MSSDKEPTGPRITRIKFENFKAFHEYTIHIGDTNILVGPNNSGKSTIIGSLRTLDAALRLARSRPPQKLRIDGYYEIGYRIPDDSIPISLENVHTNYNDFDAKIDFFISNGNVIRLIFPGDGGCILLPIATGEVINSAAAFKRQFPISLTVVPVLGPVEHREQRRERATVVDGLSTHRASRHFRSYWFYNPEGFSEFSNLVSKTWPGMSINAPELDTGSGELSMFCLEERMTRELYWVGFGFQIWCQLLTHLSRANQSSMVVVDEPEVYLHPDVQRQLLSIIRDIGADVVLATHSSEIISEADPSEIVIINKKKSQAEKIKNISGIQRALDIVGSSQNITLTALAKSRKIIFVEGLDDFRLLRRFARKLALQELGAGSGITPLPSGGFGSWQRITALASGISEALGTSLAIGAIYDRDYYSDEQIEHVLQTLSGSLKLGCVLARKEIENYLLVPAALDRAIVRAVRERGSGKRQVESMEEVNSAELLNNIVRDMKGDIQSQIMARRHDFLKSSGIDASKINRKSIEWFDERWEDETRKLGIVPGKEVLQIFRQKAQERWGITLTDSRILDGFRREDIPDDLVNLLTKLDEFRESSV